MTELATNLREDFTVNNEALLRVAKAEKGIDLAEETHESSDTPEAEGALDDTQSDGDTVEVPETQVQETEQMGTEDPVDPAVQDNPEEKKRNLESRFKDLLEERKGDKTQIAELRKSLEDIQFDIDDQRQVAAANTPKPVPGRYEKYSDEELENLQDQFLTGDASQHPDAAKERAEIKKEMRDRLRGEMRQELDKEKQEKAEEQFKQARAQYQQAVLTVLPDLSNKNHPLMGDIDEAYSAYFKNHAEGPLMATMTAIGSKALKIFNDPKADVNLRNFVRSLVQAKQLPGATAPVAAVPANGNGQVRQPVQASPPPPSVGSQRANANQQVTGATRESKKLMNNALVSGDKSQMATAFAAAMREQNLG